MVLNMGRLYSIEIESTKQENLELLALSVAYYYNNYSTKEEVLSALNAGEISRDGEYDTTISYERGKAHILFDTSYMELPNLYENDPDCMYEIFKGVVPVVNGGPFKISFDFHDDWADYSHFGKCEFDGKTIKYSDSASASSVCSPRNQKFCAQYYNGRFSNEEKGAWDKITGEPV